MKNVGKIWGILISSLGVHPVSGKPISFPISEIKSDYLFNCLNDTISIYINLLQGHVFFSFFFFGILLIVCKFATVPLWT